MGRKINITLIIIAIIISYFINHLDKNRTYEMLLSFPLGYKLLVGKPKFTVDMVLLLLFIYIYNTHNSI